MKTIPFLPEFLDAIREGRKTCTARHRRYGKAGGLLSTDAGVIVLVEVKKLPLVAIRDYWWKEEGCESPEAFEQVWCRIHPKAGYNPDSVVWQHRFKLASIAETVAAVLAIPLFGDDE